MDGFGHVQMVGQLVNIGTHCHLGLFLKQKDNERKNKQQSLQENKKM